MRTHTPRSEPSETDIAPWLSVGIAAEAVDYYKAAFSAIVLYSLEDSDGKLAVAQLSIKGADFWIQDDPDSSPESLG
jgi:PhnB protein